MGTAASDVVAGAGIGADVAIVVDVQSPRFQRADELFEFPDGSQLSSSRDEFDFYVKAHEEECTNILKSIEDNLANSTPLPEYITNLNLNIANASMEYVRYSYREKDGSYSYTKRQSKILVFKITWRIVAFCTGASGNSYYWNGDLVLWKFNCSIFVDGLGHVFDRGHFDSSVELREVRQILSEDGYYSVNVFSVHSVFPIFINEQ